MCKLYKLFLIATLALTACTGSDNPPVPRRHAYPRLQQNNPTYTLADSVPAVNFLVNTADASLRLNGKGCDIVYKNFGATVYMSVTKGLNNPDEFYDAWQNRVQRIDRNLGSAQKNTIPVKNKNFDGVVIYTLTVSQTPVQLITANPDDGVIVSATAFMHNDIPINAYDSIAPLYKALERDITKLAQSLKCK
jgi:hypothetical protein